MLRKHHTGFKIRLLAMLFLFFNCVCTAAPVLRLAGENYNDGVSLRLVETPNPFEGEEEGHAFASGYINHFEHFSVRKQGDRRFYHPVCSSSIALFFAFGPLETYLQDSRVLPIPGYYAFLFRHKLF